MKCANERSKNSEVYATASDFEQIFTQDMSSLYLLSFLLTGNQEKAEECFLAGVADCTKGNPVFKEWARSWARRAIIQNAIRSTSPRASSSAMPNHLPRQELERVPLTLQSEVYAILELPLLERFAFVMSALERYTNHDCAILLACAPRDIAEASTRAVRQLGWSLTLRCDNPSDGSHRNLAAHEDTQWVRELAIVRHLATPPLLNPMGL